MPVLSDFQTFKNAIAEWANRQDWSDDLVTSFVRGAEEKFNVELRIDRMLATDNALVTARCAPLPDDWLEMDYVSISNTAWPNGFMPLRYKARDEFFNTPEDSASNNYARGIYTYLGRQIFIGGPPDTVNGQTVQITYFQEVPVFTDTNPSWVYTKFQSMYRYASLMHADLHAVGEENTASLMKQLAEDMIQKLNQDFRFSKASGSRVTRTRAGRTFG